jgi:tartrate-resistant acid phosphatase type 5
MQFDRVFFSTVVTGHFPVFSVAEHGSTKLLVERLLPMLQAAKVTAYMNGHDHSVSFFCV